MRFLSATTIDQFPCFLGESIPSLNLAPFGRWTLRDEAAQRRLALLGHHVPQADNLAEVAFRYPIGYT